MKYGFSLFALFFSLCAVFPLCGNNTIETFRPDDGSPVFVVPLTAPSSSDVVAVDAVVAVDLSASQLSGLVREEARKAVGVFIAALPAGSRVQVFVASNEMTPIPSTANFAVASPELADRAIADLVKETPLGAMDLKNMIKVSREVLCALDESNPKSIVFIGRGVSTATFFDRHEAALLTRDLVKDRITFSAFANGAVTNNNVLACLVYQTGGHIVDLRVKDGNAAGASLAESAKAAVYWPGEESLVEEQLAARIGAESLYPKRIPPIRSDRETFLIGVGDFPPGWQIALSLPFARADGTPVSLDFDFVADKPREENRTLVRMVHDAAKDGGIALPITNRSLLREYQAALQNREDTVQKMGKQAAESGQHREASVLLGTPAATSIENKTPEQKSAPDRKQPRK